MAVLILGGIPPIPRLVFQTGMNEKHCMHVMTGGTAASTTVGPPTGMNEMHCIHVIIGRTNQGGPYLRRQAASKQGQGRFENGVLINQEGLAARPIEHTGIDMRNLGVACIRKECHGDLPRPVKIQYNVVR